jgi:hypothetical protein
MLLTGFREEIDVQQIQRENDRIIMKIHGLEYEKFFAQEPEYEK